MTIASFELYKKNLDIVLRHSRDKLNQDILSFNQLYEILDEIQTAAKSIEKNIGKI